MMCFLQKHIVVVMVFRSPGRFCIWDMVFKTPGFNGIVGFNGGIGFSLIVLREVEISVVPCIVIM